MSMWKRSEIYNDFLLKIDRPWILSFWLKKEPHNSVLFTIHGSRRRGPLDDADAQVVSPLLGHLRRAQEIRSRLEKSNVRAHSLRECWQQLNFGITILDTRGRILESNSVAEDLMRRTPGVRRKADGHLHLREPAGSLLDTCIATDTLAAQPKEGLLRVPRESALPLSLLITRLPYENSLWLSGAPRWMLLWFDPDRPITYTAELVQVEFGLSPREAEVATLLASGYDLRRICERLRISPHTARSHLKSCLTKTDCHTQTELLRRILCSAASRRSGLRHPSTILV